MNKVSSIDILFPHSLLHMHSTQKRAMPQREGVNVVRVVIVVSNALVFVLSKTKKLPMFKPIIKKVLNEVVGKYFDNINVKDLQINVLNGVLHIIIIFVESLSL